MNNEREGWEYKRNLNESKDDLQNKGNKKNNYKYKDGDRNYEYGPYRKHIKKNDYEKGRNNNENSIYNKKNNKKKRENNYEINERYSENIEEFTSELNNPIQQDERTKHKNYTQQQNNNISKKNYYNYNNNNNNQTNNINNINNNTNINNLNEQNQDKNINQFNYFQEGQIQDINYINNQNNNNQNGIVKNYNQIINQPPFRKYNNIKPFNNKGKNNNNNLSMTTSMMQIPSRNSLENQIEQTSNLNIENSQSNNISTKMNSDNLSIKSQSHYSDRTCAPLPNYGNDIFINNINKQIPIPYEQMYNYNRIPMNIFSIPMNAVNIEQNGMFNYPAFTMNSINQNNNIIMNNNDKIKDSKKKNNLINKNKGNRSNQGNKTLIPNHNNNTNLNFNNNMNGAMFINPNQQMPHYKKNINKKLGLRKLNSDKNIPLNNYPFFPQKNNLNNNKFFNQNNQKDEQILPFNNLNLKIKLPNGNELTDTLNINVLEGNFHNIAQKYVNNNNLNQILIEPIYNKIILALEMTNSILLNNTSKYDRKKLEELKNYYNSIKNEEEELSDCSLDEIIEYNKYYERIKDIKPDKNEIRNFELHNFSF